MQEIQKIQNCNGTSRYSNPKGYDSHLEKCVAKCTPKYGPGPFNCSVCGKNPAEVGAHIKFPGRKDMKQYLTPMCKGCNNKSGIFDVSPNFPHCSVNDRNK